MESLLTKDFGRNSSSVKPKGSMTINEAIALLEEKVPGSFCIEVDVWSHKHSSDSVRARSVEWSVYLGNERTHYKSVHLADAVADALRQFDEAIQDASKVTEEVV